MWIPRGLVSAQTALALFEPTWQVPGEDVLVVPHGYRVSVQPNLTVRSTRTWPAHRTVNGVPTVTPSNAVLDAWALTPVRLAADVVYRALWKRIVSAPELATDLASRPRLKRRRELAELLGYFLDGAQSPMEVIAKRDVFVGRSFSEFTWQHTIRARRRTVVADMCHERARLIVEFDGRAFHADEQSWARDRERDVLTASLGYQTLRLTWRDLTKRPEWCRSMVINVVQQRLRG
ncbi:endonuclease domain-containing protein [Demequina flava]|uniref:endonuclease domain-containing protein n=1 Tax=Demequina flava TaxID=1095025 RepID=UPI000784E947|nr:DUF559 domain-containing protein [Demequina flava]